MESNSVRLYSKEERKQLNEIGKNLTERAANGEFGWCYGIRADISWEEIQELRKNTPPMLRLVNGEYVPIEEEGK